jgi:Acyltransferase
MDVVGRSTAMRHQCQALYAKSETMRGILIRSVVSALLIVPSRAFVVSKVHQIRQPLTVALSPPDDILISSEIFKLSKEECFPILRIGKGDNEKIVNAFGFWCLFVSLVTGPLWMTAMTVVNALYKINEDWDPHRAIYDCTGKVWAKTWLTLTNSFPTVSGDTGSLQQIRQADKMTGPCLYVANHASWLDIPILCTVLDPVFKFIAKGELREVPCIGQQLDGVSSRLQHVRVSTYHLLVNNSHNFSSQLFIYGVNRGRGITY